MKNKRSKRFESFKKFQKNGKEVFENLKEDDSRISVLEELYSFYISPGSRGGGNNHRIFEVFFGKRPFDVIHRLFDSETVIEEGSTLMFQISDNGLVYISLFPAKTKYRGLSEESITLFSRLEPQKLNEQRFLKSLWMDFKAYTEYSSLEGEPSIRQRLRVWYLRNFKKLVKENKVRDSRFRKTMEKTLQYGISVGLSGFIVFIFGIHLSEISDEKFEESIQTLDKNFIETKQILKTIQENQISHDDLIELLELMKTHQTEDVFINDSTKTNFTDK